jgi:periplasmic protein TonB
MFNNLIESSSHSREYKRRGSFLLFTTGIYAVLLVLGGVASIYAYDARLEEQTTHLELLSFVQPPPAEEPPEIIRNTIRSASPSDTTPTRSTRTELIDSTSNPTNVPVDIGTKASDVPPARRDSVIDRFNADPPGPAFTERGIPGRGNTPLVDMTGTPPPPPPASTPTPVKVVKISRVLNSEAKLLPKPTYPILAKQARVQGTVAVQVLIDETGKVVSARAVSGHPLLVIEAQRAALGARFSPTIIGDQPVKVSGVITYNFVMP